MKSQFLLLFSFIPTLILAQQIELRGTVSIHNSRYNTGEIEYVNNAQIVADFSSPSVTDNNGKFTLSFVGINRGTPISVAVEKSGLEVVNRADLREVILGRLDNLRIFLAPKGELIKAQTEIYNISIKALTKRHEERIAQLKKDKESYQKITKQLEEELGRTIADSAEAEKILKDQLDKTRRRLPEFARELATTNLDFASAMYRKAYEFVVAGEIDKALETLDEKVLDRDGKRLVKDIEELDGNIGDLNDAKRIQAERFYTNMQSFYLKAEGLEQQNADQEAIDTYYKVLEIAMDFPASTLRIKEECYSKLWQLYEKTNQKKQERLYRRKHLLALEQCYYFDVEGYTELDQFAPLEGLSRTYETVSIDSSIMYQKDALSLLKRSKSGEEQIQHARARLIHLLIFQSEDLQQERDQLLKVYTTIVAQSEENKSLDQAISFQEKKYALIKETKPTDIEATTQKLIQLIKQHAEELATKTLYKEAINTYQKLLSYQPKNKQVKKRIKTLQKRIK